MEAGIVGLPNVGKSTLFNALTAAGALSANYPFATIEPNVGVAAIPDPRLKTINEKIETQQVIPASFRLVDIAGIVKGASEGEGLGNKFLSHIREVDATLQVVRCFEEAVGGEDITHVDGSVDPMRDIETIQTELILADLQTIESAQTKAERQARSKDPEAVARLEAIKLVRPLLEDGRPARLAITENMIHRDEHEKALRGLGLISLKPILYVMNVDEDDPNGESAKCQAVREHAAAEGAEVVPVCAKIESELAELDEDEKLEMLESLGMDEPALARLARGAYTLLGLQSFYTAGPKEIRAWTVRAGATAPEAAGVIHTDFQKGFIRAEIYGVDDLVELASEKAIKNAGRMRIEGKDYVMRDGDVCHFLFNL